MTVKEIEQISETVVECKLADFWNDPIFIRVVDNSSQTLSAAKVKVSAVKNF